MFYKKKISLLLRLIKKNINEIIVFIVINLFFIGANYLSLCGGYLKFASFDYQTFLTWNYSAFKNLIPYRDLYYPYGLLPYYKDGSIFYVIIYFILSLITLNVLIYILRKIFKKKLAIYLVAILILLFIYLTSNINTFNRYGISVVMSLVISYAFYLNVNNRKFYFLSGFIISLIFWLIHDQGILGFTIFSVFFFAQNLVKFKSSKYKKDIALAFHQVFLFLIGAVLGLIPFVLFLIKSDALNSFLYYLTVSLPEYPLMSKTPFFNLFFSLNNIFSIGVLTFSISFVAYKIYLKKKRSIFTFLELGLILTIILFEQKNIVRLMENAITFAAFILFAIILWEILTTFKNNYKNNLLIKFCYFTLLAFIVLSFYISYGNRSGIRIPDDLSIKPFNCYASNVSDIPDVEKYESVITKLKSFKNFNNKIFSFPGDPIFYVLLKQNQPYFTSIYEASSENSQRIITEYLNNEIKYVIINTQNKSIQDEVPNYVRGVYELKYILNNYSLKSNVNDYLILEENNNSDFFTDNKLASASEYKKYLLDINLESIPASEGKYKIKYILNNRNVFLIRDSNLIKANKYLVENETNSNETFLLVRSNDLNKYITLNITSDGNLATYIKMKSCRENYCIVNLSNIPLFYNNRIIRQINSQEDIQVSIVKVSGYNIGNLW